MSNHILFITDGSILDPILHSQGIPLLNYISDKNFSPIIFSIEKKDGNSVAQEILRLKQEFPNIHFNYLLENKNKLFPRWLWGIFLSVHSIRNIIKFNNVKVIHGRSLIPSCIGLLLKTLSYKKIKLIYDNRGVRIDEEIMTGHWKRKGIKVYIFRWLDKKLLSSSDVIIVVSHKFKTYLINSFNVINFNQNKIFIIPNRTDINSSAFSNRNINQPICVYAGSAAKWQSLNELANIFKTMISVFKDIKILILTYHLVDFQKILSHKELKDKVTLRKVPPKFVFAELSNCNFGILIRDNNLINNVASPLKFAEYLSAGLPVLISEGIGDTENIVKKNRIGVVIKNKNYVDAISEMKNLLKDPEVYKRCRYIAETEFNIQTSFEQYLDIYQKLLNDE